MDMNLFDSILRGASNSRNGLVHCCTAAVIMLGAFGHASAITSDMDSLEITVAEESRATEGIDITIAGTGSGKVTGSEGIDCSAATCSYNIGEGTNISLTAIPDTSDPTNTSKFAGWAGDCSGTDTTQCDVTAPAEVSVFFACAHSELPAGRRAIDERFECEELNAPSGFEVASEANIEFFATKSVALGEGFRVLDNGVLSIQLSPNATAAELDPPEVTVDPGLLPDAIQIAGIDGGAPRNIVRMNSDIGKGYQFDFVEDEIYLISDRPVDLAGLLSRWNGSLLFQVEMSSPIPTDQTIVYLLQVDPTGADVANLNENLGLLDGRMHGKHQVSSDSGLNLLALVTSEIKDNGLEIGINALLKSQDLSKRSSQEAGAGSDVTVGSETFNYSSNAFDWPYMETDPYVPGMSRYPLDTGTAEALRVVEADGGFSNRVRVLIADGGFYPNDDFPPHANIGSLRTPNPDPGGCGGGLPMSPECSAHGTHVALSGFGLPDNSFGTFGPGGPVSDLILLQSPSVDFMSILRYIRNNIPLAGAQRPKIVNISASISIAAGWCVLACPPMNLLMKGLDYAGITIVAAAGNENINVDETDKVCFAFWCKVFEESATVPCELDSVLCVGASQFLHRGRADYSNYGTADSGNSVDIFAPGDIYSVTALDADTNNNSPVDDLKLINGTSFASPFTAGVAALTWAANPSFSNDQVEACIMSSAHAEAYSGATKWIYPLGAVKCAMGGTHPFIEIITPSNGITVERSAVVIVLAANADDLEDGLGLTIDWISSVDGSLGTSSPGAEGLRLSPKFLSLGRHEICASTTDSSGRTSTDCVDVTFTNAPPIASILLISNGDSFIQAADIPLRGTASDPDGPIPTNIRWYIEPSSVLGTPVATGSLDTSVPASGFATGNYVVTLVAEDSDGGTGAATVIISIIPNPPNALPVVTITKPTSEEVFRNGFDRIELSATATDDEDGAIPFNEIQWFASTEGGPEQPLTVTTELTKHYVALEAVPGESRTDILIKGRVTDSGGQENADSNGQVLIYLRVIQ